MKADWEEVAEAVAVTPSKIADLAERELVIATDYQEELSFKIVSLVATLDAIRNVADGRKEESEGEPIGYFAATISSMAEAGMRLADCIEND